MVAQRDALVVKWFAGPRDCDSKEHQSPTWHDIEGAIQQLNGDTHTMLLLGVGDPTPQMGIAGGTKDNYIVYVTPDNVTFHNLINQNATAATLWMKAGGQFSSYDLRLCVSLSQVLKAARAFAETGGLEPTLAWEKQV